MQRDNDLLPADSIRDAHVQCKHGLPESRHALYTSKQA